MNEDSYTNKTLGLLAVGCRLTNQLGSIPYDIWTCAFMILGQMAMQTIEWKTWDDCVLYNQLL